MMDVWTRCLPISCGCAARRGRIYKTCRYSCTLPIMAEVHQNLWPIVQGFKIHTWCSAELRKDRPNLVLVHGLGVSAKYLVPTLGELSDQFNVYAPELPGFGRSDRPRPALNIQQLADILPD